MSCVISNKCVNCEMCEPDCPTGAITFNGKTFVINPELCRECEGIYDTPHCISVCPVHCIKRNDEKKKNIKSKIGVSTRKGKS